MKTKRLYENELTAFVKLVQLAIESYTQYPPYAQEHVDSTVRHLEHERSEAINGPGKYRNLRSLDQRVDDILIYFNEGAGTTVDYFWKRIKEEGLPYERKDVLKIVLERGKIRGRQEYDVVTDTFVPAQQEGRISAEEFERLSNMLGEYENRRSNRR